MTATKTNDTSETTRKPWWARGVVLSLTVSAFLLLGGLALWLLPGYLSSAWSPKVVDDSVTSDTSATSGSTPPASAAQIVVLALGGVVGVFGVALSLSRHGDEKLEAERDQLRLEAERVTERRTRFATLTSLIADEGKPMSRLAALHGLGALADDWDLAGNNKESRVCASLIAEYLKSPVRKANDQQLDADTQARITAVKVIREHLLAGANRSWSEYGISLEGAHFYFPANLSDISLTDYATLNLEGAEIGGSGSLDISGATVAGNADINLTKLKLSDKAVVNLQEVSLSGSTKILFNESQVADGAQVILDRMKVSEAAEVHLNHLRMNGTARLDIRSAEFRDNAALVCNDAELRDASKASLNGAKFAGNSKLLLPRLALLSHTQLNLDNTKFKVGAECKIPSISLRDHALLNLSNTRFWAGSRLLLTHAQLDDLAHFRIARAKFSEHMEQVISSDLSERASRD